uniref:FtsW/RodA/SpoVE family cell cycle protein n=1 Tax=Ornithobacterium rhinotracheale TaxID=28251 RepID=UPI0039A50E25
MKKQNRKKEGIFLLIISCFVSFLAWSYMQNIQKDLQLVEKSYSGDSLAVINLSPTMDLPSLKKIINTGSYFPDDTYTEFAIEELKNKIDELGTPKNLGALNKKAFQIDVATMLEKGGEWGKNRVLIEQYAYGLDSLIYKAELSSPTSYPSLVKISNNNTGIVFRGSIKTAKNKKKGIKEKPLKGILVKLTEEYSSTEKRRLQDSIIDKLSVDSLRLLYDSNLLDSPSFYARTDENGNFEFQNLAVGKNYSVIPIKPYKDYGDFKGAARVGLEKNIWGKPKNTYTFNFREKERTLKIFDNTAYQKIKADNIFTVRTPAEFKDIYIKSVILFILGFWIFHFVLSFKRSGADQYILPLLMFVSGISLIILFSIQEPLTGEIYGSSMAKFTLFVLILLSVISMFITPQNLYKYLSWDWVQASYRKGIKLPKIITKFSSPEDLYSKGYLWLFSSILLMILLLIFGSGPEGSGVKVNLGPIQVSELSKYLMIFFFAKYFTANHEYFRRIPDNNWLIKHNIKMLIFFVILIGIYAVLGDLGPAMVLCLTFLFFYSFAKNEFISMILYALTYVCVLFGVSYLFPKDSTTLAIVSAIVCVILAIYTLLIRKKEESGFFIVLLISAFIILEIFPFSFAKRLADRNGMFRNIWENSLNGGDQIAQGVWSLNSGGWTGQGLGNGFSNVMPAYHTDMIFQSIGEEMGLIMLVILLFAFIVLFYRSLLVAKESGKPLLFYFMAGIGIVTLIQLSVIVGGSLGLIPLTGISVPFLSKGNSSLMINLFFFGLLVILSHIKGSKIEREYTFKTFSNINAFSVITFFTIVLIFVLRLLFLQWNSNDLMIKPVIVLNKKGEYQLSENPRISIISRKLIPGDIYDRNGKLLATSDKNKFIEAENDALAINPDASEQFRQQKNSRRQRYYPYGDNLLFWLGDANSNIVSSPLVGYVAEFTNMSDLRGLNVNKKAYTTNKTSEKYREEKFLPYESKTTILQKYDRTPFLPFLKSGVKSNYIEKFNAQNKDINLTLDVELNELISNIIQNDPKFKGKHKVSVVAIKADNGEVLASTSNPAPSLKDMRLINKFNKRYNDMMSSFFGYKQYVADRDYAIFKKSSPGSTIKVADAIACLNRYGIDSAQISYFVTHDEIIHNDNGSEPFNQNVDMRKAIVKSSNVYFIKLMNEKSLHPELFDIYHSVGIDLYHKGGFFINKPDDFNIKNIDNLWLNKLSKGREIYNNPKLVGTKKRLKGSDYSFISWGQGPIEASPLQLAKIFSSIANKGKMFETEFLLKNNSTNSEMMVKRKVVANLLEDFLKEQSMLRKVGNLTFYGKTGSPERKEIIKQPNGKKKIKTVTDSWYIFYIKNSKYNSPIVFTIRIEGIGNSGHATALSEKIVSSLQEHQFFTNLN